MDALAWLRKHLESADVDLLREMVQSFAEVLMAAEADALCGAGYRERSVEQVNSRNGYRLRDFDTRVGSMELAIPKLRAGSYFPDWRIRRSAGAAEFPAPTGKPIYLCRHPRRDVGDFLNAIKLFT